MTFKYLNISDDPADASGFSGRKYYKLATITWSKPAVWEAGYDFDVPAGWAGYGGVYIFIRNHGRQSDGERFAYVGKAKEFSKRLTTKHQHYGIVKRKGDTCVSCGRIAFQRIRSSEKHYVQIEDIIKFTIDEWLENSQGFESLPGFRASQPETMIPWVISNEGHRFGGRLPKQIVYPAFAIGKP